MATTASAAASSSSVRVLVNADAYVGDKPNATTARGLTSEGQAIEASFWPAHPPLPSTLFVHCPGLGPSALPESTPPRVIRMMDDLLLFRVPVKRPRPAGFPSVVRTTRFHPVPGPQECDHFIYRADPKRPSLKRLARPDTDVVLHDDTVGLLRRGGDHYTVAALLLANPGRRVVFKLHLLDSETGSWRSIDLDLPMNRPQFFQCTTSTVITIGGEGGTMAWVNLWSSILLCDVLHPNPTLRLVPLPLPMAWINKMKARGDQGKYLGCPKPHRGIAFIKGNGCLRLVELDVDSVMLGYKDEETRGPSARINGWSIKTWKNCKMTGSLDDWHMDHELKASDIKINRRMRSLLRNSGLLQPKQPHQDCEMSAAERTLQNLFVFAPIPRMDDDKNVVYLMTSVKFLHPKACVLAVDMANNKLHGVGEFGTERRLRGGVICCPGSVSNYAIQ